MLDAQQVRHIVRQMLVRLLDELADDLENQEHVEPGARQVIDALRRQSERIAE